MGVGGTEAKGRDVKAMSGQECTKCGIPCSRRATPNSGPRWRPAKVSAAFLFLFFFFKSKLRHSDKDSKDSPLLGKLHAGPPAAGLARGSAPDSALLVTLSRIRPEEGALPSPCPARARFQSGQEAGLLSRKSVLTDTGTGSSEKRNLQSWKWDALTSMGSSGKHPKTQVI